MSPLLPLSLSWLAFGAASAQEMPAPDYQAGDRWIYLETDLLTRLETGRLTETVTAVDASDYWIDARRVARTWWRGDSARRTPREQFAFAEGAPGERGRTLAGNDGGCAYPWPLKVGQRFDCVENAHFVNGWKVRYTLSFEVEAAETLQTPAGRFDTLRLKATGSMDNQTTQNSGRHERLVWLAPAAKREVRHEIRSLLRNGQPFRVEGRELVELALAGAPAAAPVRP